ncbi:hypothetical protein WHI96_08040 [Pseudonocardia tropica]|uniref:Uncharacterized protein n=1 Tax=Pseudonocardia tropica TaxID=681289 RepID=A0ABV1JV43_9PSEU
MTAPAPTVRVFHENAYVVAEDAETGLVGRAPLHLPDAELRARENLQAVLSQRGAR